MSKSKAQMSRLAREIPWDMFVYAFIETGYFDYDTRPKSARAMKTLFERLPKKRLRELMNLSVIVFAPTPNVLGEVIPAFGSSGSECQLVYFSPELEKESQPDVDSAVAHEFAHVLFKHGLLNVDQDQDSNCRDLPAGKRKAEARADAEIQKWGYEPSYACNR